MGARHKNRTQHNYTYSQMAENQQSNQDITSPQLEGGTYEIIQSRLQHNGNDLRQRLVQLNDSRKVVFGAVETSLIANAHIATDNNCIAREIVAFGDQCILGYNVHIGLKSKIELKDVFSVYQFRDHGFHETDLRLLEDALFLDDFQNLYKYYRNTTFSRFLMTDAYLYMVFQTGKSHKDIKVFKWLIEEDGLRYVDDRSASEYKLPPQYEFEWQRSGREMLREGKHAHISILDRLFVETTGGDLTIKIEDNTDTGRGIFEEEVAIKEQTLDDAEFYYADLGNIIALKIRPYREDFRYYLYNEKLQEVRRVDTLKDAAVLLPEGHGLIFSNGYYLQTGEFKIFDKEFSNIQFDTRISSPNGEDYLYVFYQPELGEYILMSYNIIEQKVETPILCNGYTCFPNGELCYFRAETNPSKHHVIQIWQTPYTTNGIIKGEQTDNYLYKVGNKDIVRAMSECYEVLTLLNKEDSYQNLYLDLVRKTTNVLDAYYWLNQKEAFSLAEPLKAINATAGSAIDEFEKVQRIKEDSRRAVAETEQKIQALISTIKRARFETVDDYVKILADLRSVRGELISLKELRYVDLAWIAQKEEALTVETDRLSEGCIGFLLEDDALAPYQEKVVVQTQALEEVSKVTEANEQADNLDQIGKDLELLIDIVSNLKITDATQTTRIIDNISAIFVSLNQQKAKLKNKKKALFGQESTAEFAAQLKLLDQSIINYLDLSDTPLRCDEYLTRLMVSLEELEGRFVEFDEFTEQIYEKRTEINNAFEARKLQLVEIRNRRAASLQNAAERIFKGVRNKLKNFKEVEAINAYFATDLMVDKVRDIIRQLVEVEDNVKAEDVQSQLKSIKEEAIRQLKDRQDLFVEGKNVIKLGKHHFAVNVQPLDLTTVLRGEEMYFHLTGTNFFEKINDSSFLATRHLWDQSLISESKQVYRSEYLAHWIFKHHYDTIKDWVSNTDQLLAFTRQMMANRYLEGYTKGVHDQDAAIILQALLQLHNAIDLLRYAPDARACAALYWEIFEDQEEKKILNHQIKGAGLILNVFPESNEFQGLIQELSTEITQFLNETQLFDLRIAEAAGEYLFYELSRSDNFVISQEANDLYQQFTNYLHKGKHKRTFQQSFEQLKAEPARKYALIRQWLSAFIQQKQLGSLVTNISEVATLLMLDNYAAKRVIHTPSQLTLEGFSGSHTLVEGGHYQLHYIDYMEKMRHYFEQIVPQFKAFSEQKKEMNATYKQSLRLSEFKPRVLSSFVRNQLIDQLYLDIIGDNLAKQIGVVGDQKRTDLMGMLLLISPPGYGKTTLMEYLCSRLGLIFMKINGPAIGHAVTSLDPAEATNAAAREELKKLNLAFEMGDNVMIYVDDIQHCHPEFLQKFISLCDGQRKVEGVYKGVSKTYDLRGKRVCVVMAGNPYTESGDRFTIPDMLANRADTYNLGDIIGDSAELFKLSYLENSLTSNPTLNRLASRSIKDVLSMIKIAETDQQEGITFEASHSKEEMNEYISVLKKLLRIRDVILRVNLEYIKSAAIEDRYRTEPPFKLQGSYRDMNKLAARVVPIMNDEELETLILSHYESESQTLTSGAEANLLKFKVINDLLSEEEAARWKEIRSTFKRHQLLNGNNQMGQLVGQLTAIAKGLDGYSKAFIEGMERISDRLEKE